MKAPFSVIGDVHGNYDKYLEIIEESDFSVQLGDMGLNYDKIFDVSMNHRFIPGNHDNYDNLPNNAFQSDYGQISLGHLDFFYIRGAYSIDKASRLIGISWWEQEEIKMDSAIQLIETVEFMQPRYILSHDCPEICLKEGVATNKYKRHPSFTTQMMSEVWKAHKPEFWLFGHHHKNWDKTIEGTRFIGINELSSVDIYPDGDIIWRKRTPVTQSLKERYND